MNELRNSIGSIDKKPTKKPIKSKQVSKKLI